MKVINFKFPCETGDGPYQWRSSVMQTTDYKLLKVAAVETVLSSQSSSLTADWHQFVKSKTEQNIIRVYNFF